jgi:hypothetical protein
MWSRTVLIVCTFALVALALTGVSEASSAVQTATGNYTYRFTDVTFVVGDAQFTFARAYNSLDTRTKAPFGTGWTHTFNVRLNTSGDTSGDLIVTSGTGGSTRFAPAGNIVFTPTRGAAQGTLRLVTDAGHKPRAGQPTDHSLRLR